jgi:hypothetical protein
MYVCVYDGMRLGGMNVEGFFVSMIVCLDIWNKLSLSLSHTLTHCTHHKHTQNTHRAWVASKNLWILCPLHTAWWQRQVPNPKS